MRTTHAVELGDLVINYDGRTAVRGMSLVVVPGEWVTIIGPNGAGKSTLLRAIAGILPAHSGTIRLFDTPLERMSRRHRARTVAMVAQAPLVPPGIRVLDYVLLGRTPHISLLGTESRADLTVVARVLERLELTGFADRALDTLSGGERQRAFLARALAQEARLLLLDEPTTALDIGHQQDMLELVDSLRKDEGLTVVATTHELSLAGEYADRLVMVADGAVVASGPASEVLTAELLGLHYGARVQVIPSEYGPVIIPERRCRH